MRNKTYTLPSKSSSKSFTLIELIVVIIIVGILAAVGINQYALTVEKARLAGAKVRIGVMKQLAYEYYLNNGTIDGMTNADVGVDNTCTSADFFKYLLGIGVTNVNLIAERCTSGGKTPNSPYGRYQYYLYFDPYSGENSWHCWDEDQGSCFGLPS